MPELALVNGIWHKGSKVIISQNRLADTFKYVHEDHYKIQKFKTHAGVKCPHEIHGRKLCELIEVYTSAANRATDDPLSRLGVVSAFILFQYGGASYIIVLRWAVEFSRSGTINRYVMAHRERKNWDLSFRCKQDSVSSKFIFRQIRRVFFSCISGVCRKFIFDLNLNSQKYAVYLSLLLVNFQVSKVNSKSEKNMPGRERIEHHFERNIFIRVQLGLFLVQPNGLEKAYSVATSGICRQYEQSKGRFLCLEHIRDNNIIIEKHASQPRRLRKTCSLLSLFRERAVCAKGGK